jgi:hypothetical protein
MNTAGDHRRDGRSRLPGMTARDTHGSTDPRVDGDDRRDRIDGIPLSATASEFSCRERAQDRGALGIGDPSCTEREPTERLLPRMGLRHLDG